MTLVGRLIGLDLPCWPHRDLHLALRFNGTDGIARGTSPTWIDGSTWHATVQPGPVELELLCGNPTSGQETVWRSSVFASPSEGDPPYPIPEEIALWRSMPFSDELVRIDVSGLLSAEVLRVHSGLGTHCGGLTGVLSTPGSRHAWDKAPADMDTFVIVTRATGQPLELTVSATGMLDATHTWIAAAGTRTSSLTMECAPRVSVALDTGSPAAGNRLFGVMLCRGELSAPTDGVDLRGEVRTSSFFPLPGDSISLAISAFDGTFGLRGVLGERTSTGRYRVTWTGPEIMPLEGDDLLTSGVRCPPSLWRGWPQ